MEQIKLLSQLLNEHLNTGHSQELISQEMISSLEELKKILSQKIQMLMDEDLEGLLQAMYRIDVPEMAFQKALAEGDAEQLAELVIQRELQKVKIRQKYKYF